jgi:hypothetical protein
MEEFLHIRNEINIEEDTQAETQEADKRIQNKKDLHYENMSLKRSVRIIVL